MSYITFKIDDYVYINGIGYGTLVDCGKFKTISLKNQNATRKNDSVIFDPDLFRLDSDSGKSKRDSSPQNQQSVQIKKQQVKSQQKPKESDNIKLQQSSKNKQIPKKEINIVSIKMTGSQFMIYTPDTNISKTVDLIIKPILLNKLDQIVITIEINKTIQSLKKLIFQKLEQQIANYYNIKLFAVNPIFTQLNINSKTIYQCGLKNCAKIVLQAKYAFSFEDVPKELAQILTLTNGNTISRNKPKKPDNKNNTTSPTTSNNNQKNNLQDKIQQKKNQLLKHLQQLKNQNNLQELQKINANQNLLKQSLMVEQLAILAQIQQNNKNLQANKIQNVPEQNKNEEALKQQQKKTQPDLKPQPQKSLDMEQNNSNDPLSFLNISYLPCKASFTSGMHYWQFKIDKGACQTDVWIGFRKQQQAMEPHKTCWAYLPLGGKKFINGQWSEYGFNAKPSDSVGVLLAFNKKRKASIIFYKNMINCGQFATDISGPLIPMVGLGGQSQITLDSRAQFPLDSFRIVR